MTVTPRMGVRTFFALILALLVWDTSGARAQGGAQTEVDYIVLLDVSGSMVGLPPGSGNADIFGDVQASLTAFIDELDPGTTVFVAPFAGGIREVERFNVGADREAAKDFVGSLRADGSRTHVYTSLLEAFSAYNDFRASQAARRIGVVLVYTDGQDNSPGGRTMKDVVEEFGLERQPDDFLYYSTLGVELAEADRAALNGSGFALYNPNPEGEVHPLRVIEPRYPLLDFGNLLTSGSATRELRFDVRGGGELPGNTVLRPTARFEAFEAQGAAAEVDVEGAGIDPAGDAAVLRLRTVNADPATVENGTYEGVIQFEANVQGVLALPVRARFRFQPVRTVGFAGDPGGLDLGTVDPHGEGAAMAEATVPLSFNGEALAQGGGFTVRVEPSPDRPLPPDAFSVNGAPGLVHDVEVGGGQPLTFAVAVPDGVEPGRYEGRLLLENGPEVEVGDAEVRTWAVEVAATPRSVLEWLILGLLVALALALLVFVLGGLITGVWPFWKRPTLRGQLAVIRGGRGAADIPLRGQREVRVGAGTDALEDASGRLLVRAEYARKGLVAHTITKAISEDGVVLILRPGERHGEAFGAEELSDQDRIELSPYTLEYVPY